MFIYCRVLSTENTSLDKLLSDIKPTNSKQQMLSATIVEWLILDIRFISLDMNY